MSSAHTTASAGIKAVAVDPVLDADMDQVLMDTFLQNGDDEPAPAIMTA